MKVKQKTFASQGDLTHWLTEFCSNWNSNFIVGMVKDHGWYEVFYKSFTEDDKLL